MQSHPQLVVEEGQLITIASGEITNAVGMLAVIAFENQRRRLLARWLSGKRTDRSDRDQQDDSTHGILRAPTQFNLRSRFFALPYRQKRKHVAVLRKALRGHAHTVHLAGAVDFNDPLTSTALLVLLLAAIMLAAVIGYHVWKGRRERRMIYRRRRRYISR